MAQVKKSRRSDLMDYLSSLDNEVAYAEPSIPRDIFAKLRGAADAVIMRAKGYEQMTLQEALDSEKQAIWTYDRSKFVRDAVYVTGDMYEFPGGSLLRHDLVWAK